METRSYNLKRRNGSSPIKKYRNGDFEILIWKKGNGNNVQDYRFSFHKSYMDHQTGQWKSSPFFTADELVSAKELFDYAYHKYLNATQNDDSQQSA